MGAFNSNIDRAVLHHLEKGETPLLHRIQKNNRIVLHNYHSTVTKTMVCKLPCCGKKFQVTLVPNQVVYPKYCEEHRTGHRRRHFLDSKACLLKTRPAMPLTE